MIRFELKHPRATEEMLGWIPEFLSQHDERPAKEQLDKNYAHGGGWSPMPGNAWTMLPNGNIKYPGDPETRLLAEARLREEVIRIYEHAWVAIIQPSGEFEIARMD